MNIHKTIEPKAATTSYFLLLAVIIVINTASAHAESVGYDENTEVVVRGIVRQNTSWPFMGLQCFILQSGSKAFRVIVGPRWFVKRMGFRLHRGADVEVVGSKFFASDGYLCILSKSLRFQSSGQTVVLRDQTCKPLWQDSDFRESSCLSIFHRTR
ncbi:MAG: hypothetical protein BA864_03765 [Desulfuromonadales bacterium C00003093]|nr:MAG: hypothetical protein BA864_03765 [Desulfuromonadales bacterium C00003093]